MTRAWGEFISQAVIISFCCWVIWMGQDYSFGGNLQSNFAAYGTLLLSLMVVYQTYRDRAKELAAKIEFDFSYFGLKAWIMAIAVVAYVFLILFLGYFTATGVYLIASTYLTGLNDLKLVGITAAILIPLMYGFFEIFLKAGLPEGILI
ncbi:MAG: hypothetical protein HOB79_07040 [Rhodospirillaceae bacterium]|jgi:hypothetical protein|nr:hypothetical protein [Rhodospirillaceae bacterium]MBT7486028.1 hypothetical protein [Rhodospirillales bacterium]MBT4700818.1 hypothetical protein [Rhodospirillaceae bacterium]MBT5036846.1 hypothetical protein [Rhodospirillaceae bacterium]MBT6219539.1 hypothetical protein [Rhodospirillaceae bacterium]